MEPMKPSEPVPLSIPHEIAAKCTGVKQFDNFDALFRADISVPKATFDKEAKWRRGQTRKKRAPKPAH